MPDALERLIEAAKGGAFPADTSARDLGIADIVDNTGLPLIKLMYAAFGDDMTAAIAVQKALLPDHNWRPRTGRADVGAATPFRACVVR